MLNIKLGKYSVTNDAQNYVLGIEKEVEVIKDKVKTGEMKKIISPIGYFGSWPQVFNRLRKEEQFVDTVEYTEIRELVWLLEKLQSEDIAWCKENLKKFEV